jgi:glycosyltransferase involved in cell wall biosynthesis
LEANHAWIDCGVMSVLYISYDGMLEPLGQSQVLAYLNRLAVVRPIHLISFEKTNDWVNADERELLAREIAASGIVWYPLRYHKGPTAVATAWDILCGVALGLWLVLRYRLRLVHARSYVSSVMALAIKLITGSKYLFDMRGFWADERVDGNLWPRTGRMYRVAKWFEQRFLLSADHIIVLTHAAVRELKRLPCTQNRMPPVSVISTCANLSRFIPSDCPPKELVLGYVGTVGTWYLFDETVAVFSAFLRLRPDARILIVNRNEHDIIYDRLKVGGVPLSAVEVRVARHVEMPQQIARMSASVFFIKPVFSKQASAPTKLGELLGCGVPCLSNAGVGDMADIIESERVGVAVVAFDAETLEIGLTRLMELVLDPDIRRRCTAAAHKYFSLDDGVERYESVYQQLGV